MMHIKEFVKFELKDNYYYPFYPKSMQSTVYVAIFFHDAFRHIYRSGTTEFVKKLKNYSHSGMSSEMIELSLDNENNLAYLSEPYDWSKKEITPEIERLIDQLATIELCHRNFIGYAVMTQDNLFHLLLRWEQLRNKKDLYLLIYLDDNNWYDSTSFATEALMNQFLTDHAGEK